MDHWYVSMTSLWIVIRPLTEVVVANDDDDDDSDISIADDDYDTIDDEW
jgi:hypothetical protein